MSEPLKFLDLDVRTLLTPEFRSSSDAGIAFSDFLQPSELGRDIDLRPLREVVRGAMPQREPEDSDSYLAPRVHAALRLTRREAAERRLWCYLNVAFLREYVYWRFGHTGKVIPLDRFIGEDTKNALGRLWWTAELTRNGSDYSTTEIALALSGFVTYWQNLDAIHHRPFAIAVAKYLRDANVTGDRRSQLAKAVNLRLAATSLDALCGKEAGDSEVVRRWCREPIVVSDLVHAPLGPPEPKVAGGAITRVTYFLTKVDFDLPRRPRLRTGPLEPAIEPELSVDDIPS